jgi:hypothetical protein
MLCASPGARAAILLAAAFFVAPVSLTFRLFGSVFALEFAADAGWMPGLAGACAIAGVICYLAAPKLAK